MKTLFFIFFPSHSLLDGLFCTSIKVCENIIFYFLSLAVFFHTLLEGLFYRVFYCKSFATFATIKTDTTFSHTSIFDLEQQWAVGRMNHTTRDDEEWRLRVFANQDNIWTDVVGEHNILQVE